jgi:hypothetical protein
MWLRDWPTLFENYPERVLDERGFLHSHGFLPQPMHNPAFPRWRDLRMDGVSTEANFRQCVHLPLSALSLSGLGSISWRTSATFLCMSRQYWVWCLRVATCWRIEQYQTAHRSSDSSLCFIAAWMRASSLNRVMSGLPCGYCRYMQLLAQVQPWSARCKPWAVSPWTTPECNRSMEAELTKRFVIEAHEIVRRFFQPWRVTARQLSD